MTDMATREQHDERKRFTETQLFKYSCVGLVFGLVLGVLLTWMVQIRGLPTNLTDAMIRDLHHGSFHAHGAEFLHVYKDSSGKAATTPHRHCFTHDVNGDGDTNDLQDNDGTCPDPNTNIPDLPWHPPLPKKTNKFWKTLEDNVIILQDRVIIEAR